MSALFRRLPLVVAAPQTADGGPRALAARAAFDAGERVKFFLAPETPEERTGLAARWADAIAGGQARAGVAAEIFDPGTGADAPAIVWSNGGDEYGEARPGGEPLSCPPETIRWLRDLTAARFADLPAGVEINRQADIAGSFPVTAPAGFPWVRLGVSASWLASGPAAIRRPGEFSARFGSLLMLWCRAEEWS